MITILDFRHVLAPLRYAYLFGRESLRLHLLLHGCRGRVLLVAHPPCLHPLPLVVGGGHLLRGEAVRGAQLHLGGGAHPLLLELHLRRLIVRGPDDVLLAQRVVHGQGPTLGSQAGGVAAVAQELEAGVRGGAGVAGHAHAAVEVSVLLEGN